jgi:predicted DNA-binding transcriptional regulator YafY
LTQFKDIAIFKDYENAIEKVLDKVNFGGFRSGENVQYIQFENSPTVSGNEFLAPLLHGISTHKLVEFSYKSFKANEISKRVVEPYLLKEYKNRWYLVAREGASKIYKVFGLERMKDVHITCDQFERDARFDAKNYFTHSVGITTTPGNQPQNVRLRCHPVLLQYLESQPIHHSQKIEFLPEGGIVSLFVEITYELEQFLLSFGSELTVLEPRILRESLIKKHQSAIDNYSKKQS